MLKNEKSQYRASLQYKEGVSTYKKYYSISIDITQAFWWIFLQVIDKYKNGAMADACI